MMLLLRFGPRSASDLNEDDDDDDDDDVHADHADQDDDKYENRRGSIMMGNIEIGCEQRAQAAPPMTPPRNRLGTEEFKKPTKMLIFKNNNSLENNNNDGGLGSGHIQTSILPGLQNSQRSTNTNNNNYNAEDGASLYTVTGESIENASLTETTPILYQQQQQQQQQLQLEQQQLEQQQQSSSSNSLAFIKNSTPRVKNSLLKRAKKKRASQVALASTV